VALIALLVINAVILAVVLTRGGAPATAPATAAQGTPTTGTPPTGTPATSAPATPTAAGTASPAGVTSDHFSPMDAPAPVYAPEIPAAPDYAGAARRAPHAPASSDATARHDARVPDPVLTDNSPSDGEVLPSINEINLADQPALANLHLDVHVYATQPSERFVYINMRRYREGATLAEGPVLERIRRDGVVLNYQGLRFVLPRQQ